MRPSSRWRPPLKRTPPLPRLSPAPRPVTQIKRLIPASSIAVTSTWVAFEKSRVGSWLLCSCPCSPLPPSQLVEIDISVGDETPTRPKVVCHEVLSQFFQRHLQPVGHRVRRVVGDLSSCLKRVNKRHSGTSARCPLARSYRAAYQSGAKATNVRE